MKVGRGLRLLFALSVGVAGTFSAIAQTGYDAGPGAAYGGDARARAKVHTELGSLYFQEGNMGVALGELNTALEADSSYAPAYSVRGLVHAYLREKDEAEADFKKALNLTPNDPEINNNYGWFLCQNGKERQSLSYFLNAIKDPLYSTPDRAYTNAGTCALKAGDLEGAEQYLQQALRLSRTGGETARVQLAALNYQRGTIEEARRLITEVLRTMDTASAEALWLAIRIEHKLGNRQSESGFVSQLRSRYPASKEYQEYLKGNLE